MGCPPSPSSVSLESLSEGAETESEAPSEGELGRDPDAELGWDRCAALHESPEVSSRSAHADDRGCLNGKARRESLLGLLDDMGTHWAGNSSASRSPSMGAAELQLPREMSSTRKMSRCGADESEGEAVAADELLQPSCR